MINIRMFLLVFFLLAIITGAGAVALYYQSVMAERIERDRVMDERAEKKKAADKYYFNSFYCSFLFHMTIPGGDSEIKETTEQMHKDGYSYAEIGAISQRACGMAFDDYLARQQALKDGEAS